MIVDYIQKNFHRAVYSGVILQCAGGLTCPIHSYPLLAIFGWLITIVGTILLLAGFAFYVKSKGRSIAWSFLALLSIVGWIILIFLKDKSSVAPAKE
jgi:hypothetical protein